MNCTGGNLQQYGDCAEGVAQEETGHGIQEVILLSSLLKNANMLVTKLDENACGTNRLSHRSAFR